MFPVGHVFGGQVTWVDVPWFIDSDVLLGDFFIFMVVERFPQ